MTEEKSLCVTYFLWLFLGWLGVHHFYLRRDRQAFVWWSTLGGYCGAGWVRDFWRIPEYVDDANDENEYTENLQRRFKLRKIPQFNMSRFVGELLIGCYYGLLVRLAFPEEVPLSISGFFVCLGITMGVYLVGNIGREKGPFWIPFLACVASYIILTFMAGEEASYMYCSVATSSAFNSYRQHRIEKNNAKNCTRIAKLSFGASIILLLWAGFLTYNATITYQNGEQIKLRDSVVHFFKSPAWMDFKNTFWNLYTKQEESNGEWKKFYQDILQAFDPTGENYAQDILGVSVRADDEDIRKAYKKLVVKWHPDRYKGTDKQQAEKKFIEIQQAYELLQKRKKIRSHRTEF